MISTNVAMTGSYDYGLVALPVLMAVSASYTTLDLAGLKLLEARQLEQLTDRRSYVHARNHLWSV
jgi:NO-binding membrane sensor protein with MHYT domain